MISRVGETQAPPEEASWTHVRLCFYHFSSSLHCFLLPTCLPFLLCPLQSCAASKPSRMPFFDFSSPTPDLSYTVCVPYLSVHLSALYCQLSCSFHSSIHLLIVFPERQHGEGARVETTDETSEADILLLIDI